MRGYAVVCILALASAATAGNIDILGIRSAEYLMELSRNAVTDRADGVTYNPAGLVHMKDGLHLCLGAQYIGKDYSINGTFLGAAEETETRTTKPTPFIPNFYAVYRTGSLAVFGGFNAPAGGGSLEYEDGLFIMPLLQTVLVQAQFGPSFFAVLDQGYMEGTSFYLRGIGGVSYAFTDKLSAGIGGRYTVGHRNFKGEGTFIIIDGATMEPSGLTTAELDVERSASGLSGVLSLNYRASDRLNLAARYETATALDFESSANVQSAWEVLMPYLADGAKQRRDLPGVAGIGVEMAMSPRLRLGGSANYYFLKAADQGEEDGIDDAYDDGWEANVSARYQFSPRFAGGIGYSYSNNGGNDSTYTDLEYNLDAGLLSGGVNWRATESLDFTLAAGRVFSGEGHGAGIYEGETFNKKVLFIAFGANASF
jgi:long-chain fatty acid transport protein